MNSGNVYESPFYLPKNLVKIIDILEAKPNLLIVIAPGIKVTY